MKLLSFVARSFAWQPFAGATEAAEPEPAGGACADCVVVFVHAESRDEDPERRKSTLDHARKHVEWLARKGDVQRVVLHSFAHLGGASAAPGFGEAWIRDLGAQLAARGREVAITPFGWTNAWQIDVRGDAIAKVWKDL